MGVDEGKASVSGLPEAWTLRPLFDLVRPATGQVSPRHEPYASMTLVAPDHIESETGRLMTKRSAADQGAISGKYLFKPGDVVYSKIRPYLRKAFLADFDGLCSADMYPLSPRGETDSRFLLATLLGHAFSVFAESASARSGIPKINRDELAEFSVATPPPAEQRAIAATLSDVDVLLAKLDQLIAKKRDLKQAAMQQLLTGRIRLAGFSAPWNAAPLREVAFIRNDKALPTSLPPETLCIELEHIGQGTGQLVGASTAAFSTSAKYRFSQGDVLFGRLRAYLRKHWLADRAGVCSTEIWPLVGKPGRLASSYLSSLVQTDKFSDAAAVSYGTHMPRADWSVIGALEFRLPPFEEQCAIGTAIRDMDAELAALDARRDKTRQLKQGMMQALLTGRIRLT